MSDSGPSVFRKFIADDGPGPEPIPAPNPRTLPTGRLLNWLIHHWDEPVISARDLVTYARSIRTSEQAVTLLENLEKRGWLIRLPTHRYDRRVWAIVRDPAQLGAPAHADSSNQTAVA